MHDFEVCAYLVKVEEGKYVNCSKNGERPAEATIVAGFKVSGYDVRCSAATTLILSILNLLKMLTAVSVGS